MDGFAVMWELSQPAKTKILILILDGLGGLPLTPSGPTELEAATTPNLDRLAREGICGLSEPVGAGITPGSGPGHLALFGYDPFHFVIGRGVLEALGIGFPLEKEDVAARGNFCTVDDDGNITDRRAGRIPTEKCRELVEMLRQIRIPGVETGGAGIAVDVPLRLRRAIGDRLKGGRQEGEVAHRPPSGVPRPIHPVRASPPLIRPPDCPVHSPRRAD